MADATWQLQGDDKKKAKSALSDWAKALIAMLVGTMEDHLPGLAVEGAEWGGGLSEEDIVKQISTVLNSQEDYAADFLDDINTRIDKVLGDVYENQSSFVDSVMDTFEWAKSRAESYAVGGGIPAWRGTALEAMKQGGSPGGIWICTFGPNSCEDCQNLHGQFLTNEELAEEWGNQECGPGCECGFMPANSADELSDGDLQEIDGEE